MAQERRTSEPLVADCMVRAVADLFTHTWDPVVLAALRAEPLRRRDLRAAIGGVSDKVLTQALRRLTRAGLVERRALAGAPPRVDYATTDLGNSLVDGPITSMGDWAVEHGHRLLPPE